MSSPALGDGQTSYNLELRAGHDAYTYIQLKLRDEEEKSSHTTTTKHLTRHSIKTSINTFNSIPTTQSEIHSGQTRRLHSGKMAPTMLRWLALAATTTSVLALSNLVGHNNYAYIGCYQDNANPRPLPNGPPKPNLDGMTIEYCLDQCAGDYKYIGVEYMHECWCGNTKPDAGLKQDDSTCNDACVGDPTEACGGSALISVYELDLPAGAPVIPKYIGSNYTYDNCYVETQSARAVYGANGDQTDFSVIGLEACAASCSTNADYTYLGMDGYGHCICGPSLNTDLGTSTDCNLPCNANTTEACGGNLAMQVYSRVADPAAASAASSAAKAAASSSRSASRSSVTSSKSAASVAAAASRSSVTSSKSAYSASRSSSRSAATSSKSVHSNDAAASRSSVTSSRSSARSYVTSSKSVWSVQQAASRSSVTSSLKAYSDSVAASRASVTSSRNSANSYLSSSRSVASASRSSANSVNSSSRAAASSSRASYNSAASSSRAAASSSKSVNAAAVSSSKAAASSSRSIYNASVSSVRSVSSAAAAASRSAASAAKATTTQS